MFPSSYEIALQSHAYTVIMRLMTPSYRAEPNRSQTARISQNKRQNINIIVGACSKRKLITHSKFHASAHHRCGCGKPIRVNNNIKTATATLQFYLDPNILRMQKPRGARSRTKSSPIHPQ